MFLPQMAPAPNDSSRPGSGAAPNSNTSVTSQQVGPSASSSQQRPAAGTAGASTSMQHAVSHAGSSTSGGSASNSGVLAAVNVDAAPPSFNSDATVVSNPPLLGTQIDSNLSTVTSCLSAYYEDP